MAHQNDTAKASVTRLTPEPEFSKSGIPLHMMDPLTIEEEIPASDMPDLEEDIGIEEALTTL
tara:strand:- start:83 stop:268 length:186 start_codon:yes stop_codon:yes gene_type:complete